MPKLELVIADYDKAYVEGMVNYLTTKQSNIFNITYFTESNFMINFLTDTNKKVDILLICPEFYDQYLNDKKIKTIILLSEGELDEKYEGCSIIYKYQTGNKLSSQILDTFCKQNDTSIVSSNQNSNTKVIAIYSAYGGAGKTTIALASSILCAKKQFKVFYLNFESIQSTSLYLDCNSEYSLSRVIYYIKEDNKNINFKIDSIKNRSEDYGSLFYFSPPESAVDLNELSCEEIEKLISILKSSGKYDFIIIDMESSFNSKNISIFKLCNKLVYIFTEETISIKKAEFVSNEFKIISEKENIDIQNKTIPVFNKSDNANAIEHILFMDKPIYAVVPNNQGITIMNESFKQAISSLISNFT